MTAIHRLVTAAAVLLIVKPCLAEEISETIRLWGNPQMKNVVARWNQNLPKHRPLLHIDSKLLGTETAMAGLYSGVADLALMGRPATAKEIMAFEWVFKYKPLGIAIMTGSLNASGKSPALVVLVHRDNPLSQLTLSQLEAIFSCEHLPGSVSVRNWRQLGLRGSWGEQEIHEYGFDAHLGSASFFQQVVMNGSGKWNWPQLREFTHVKEIVDALAHDPAGIAIADGTYSDSRVRPVALAAKDGRFYEASTANLIAQRYPLTRLVFAYVNRRPGKAVDANVRELLDYILSDDGQRDALADGGYLPLNANSLEQQRDKLR